GALLSGEALMLASDIMVKSYAEGGCVRRVLTDWSGPEVPLSAVFPRGRVISPKVRAFVDFMVERLNVDADYMELHCPGSKTRKTPRPGPGPRPPDHRSFPRHKNLWRGGRARCRIPPAWRPPSAARWKLRARRAAWWRTTRRSTGCAASVMASIRADARSWS